MTPDAPAPPTVTVVGSFAVGMTIRMPRMPVFGETLLGTDFDMGPGGKGSNQAVAAARLGARAHFVGIVGDDQLAGIARDLYRAEGVGTEHLHATSERATGVGLILLDQGGENFIVLDMGANDLMDRAFVERARARIESSDVVMSVLEIPTEAAARGLELAHAAGATTVLNPAPARALPDAIFAAVDVLTPNDTELRILLGRPPDDPTPSPDLAAELRERGVGTVVVTRGAEGALVLDGDASYEVAALPVEVVDTTGAGDAFSAGLAVALAEGRPLRDAVRFACCTGALACTRLGVVPALARRAQADDLYARRFGATDPHPPRGDA